jgi:hypothetical protein
VFIECVAKGLDEKLTLFVNELSFENVAKVLGCTYVF